MPLQATRAIGTGDGWDVTDSGIYVPDWAELEDVRPESIIENPQRQQVGIDLFAGAGGFSCGFKQAGWHVVAANECGRRRGAHLPVQPRLVAHRIVFCTPQDEDRWERRRKRLQRYHSQPERPSLEPGSGWIAGQAGVQPCEVFFFGDVRVLTGERILDELDLAGDDIGCVFGGPPCQGFSRAGKRQHHDPRNELVFELGRREVLFGKPS